MTKTTCSTGLAKSRISMKFGAYDSDYYSDYLTNYDVQWIKEANLTEYAELVEYSNDHFIQITLPNEDQKWQTLHPISSGIERCSWGGHVWADTKNVVYEFSKDYHEGVDLSQQMAAFSINHDLYNNACSTSSSIKGAGNINVIETSGLVIEGQFTWGVVEGDENGQLLIEEGSEALTSAHLTTIYNTWRGSYNGVEAFETFTEEIANGKVKLRTSDSRSSRPAAQHGAMYSNPRIIYSDDLNVSLMPSSLRGTLRAGGYLNSSDNEVASGKYVSFKLRLVNNENYDSIEEVHATYCHCECDCLGGGGN